MTLQLVVDPQNRQAWLARAREWGREARDTESPFEQEWALMVAQYGIDQEAFKEFTAGYRGE